MRAAFRRIRTRVLVYYRKRHPRRKKKKTSSRRDWKEIRVREFRRRYGRFLEVGASCRKCRGPFSERMRFCPWCGADHRVYRGPTAFPARCGRCGRGLKLDWRFCPWCYGAGIGPHSARTYTDARYDGRCSNPDCDRKEQIPFMRYCPWCRTKVRKNWRLRDTKERCRSCGWGVVSEFWEYCPWCGKRTKR